MRVETTGALAVGGGCVWGGYSTILEIYFERNGARILDSNWKRQGAESKILPKKVGFCGGQPRREGREVSRVGLKIFFGDNQLST